MVIIIVIIIAIMVMMIKIILIIAAILRIIINNPFQLGNFSTGSTAGVTDNCRSCKKIFFFDKNEFYSGNNSDR